MIIEVGEDNFQDIVAANNIIFLDFWAPWCVPSRSFAPIYESLSEEYNSIVFATVHVEDESNLVKQLQVKDIPTIMVFVEGQFFYKHTGRMNREKLLTLITAAEGKCCSHKVSSAFNYKPKTEGSKCV